MTETATEAVAIEPRMEKVINVIPEAMTALTDLAKSAKGKGVPRRTALLVELRASQINGCSLCTEMHARELRQMGESEERIWTVAAWREAPHFSAAERAALALAEAATRLSDRPDPVSDEIWAEAARHYDERALAALIVEIALINVWNRLNAVTRQPAGSEWA